MTPVTIVKKFSEKLIIDNYKVPIRVIGDDTQFKSDSHWKKH